MSLLLLFFIIVIFFDTWLSLRNATNKVLSDDLSDLISTIGHDNNLVYTLPWKGK